MNYKIILAIIMITATANVTIGVGAEAAIKAYAEKSPYDSGFDHAEDDCRLAQQDRASQMYILEPDKGPNFHTQQFMNGYYDGWYDNGNGCPIQDLNDHLYYNDGYQNTRIQTNTAIDDSNFDDHSQQQGNAVETVQSNNQRGECGQIVFGDCNIGQSNSQRSENTQANSAQND